MKGKINLSIEPRINTFLARAQKNLTETQPELKKYFFYLSKEFISNLNQLLVCCKAADKL